MSLLFHGTVADSQTGLIQQQLQLEDLTVHVLAGLVVAEGLEVAADDLVMEASRQASSSTMQLPAMFTPISVGDL